MYIEIIEIIYIYIYIFLSLSLSVLARIMANRMHGHGAGMADWRTPGVLLELPEPVWLPWVMAVLLHHHGMLSQVLGHLGLRGEP